MKVIYHTHHNNMRIIDNVLWENVAHAQERSTENGNNSVCGMINCGAIHLFQTPDKFVDYINSEWVKPFYTKPRTPTPVSPPKQYA